MLFRLLLLACCFLPAIARAQKTKPARLTKEDEQALPAPLRLLLPLHKPKAEPEIGDWLFQHSETAQTYREYLASRPVRATRERRVIWVQPLGDFSPEQRKIVDLAGKFLGGCFQLPVELTAERPLSVVPDEARRKHPATDQPQIRSTWVLDPYLKSRLPKDAAAFIALTSSDLWPGDGWNFVFGQASLQDRVGVWSFHRFGNPARDEEWFQLVLRRTLRTAAHETGHMFSLPHCVHFECLMNGSNHLNEADQQPLALCPQCLAKLSHATGADPKQHFRDLVKFSREHHLTAEHDFWQKSLETLEKAKP